MQRVVLSQVPMQRHSLQNLPAQSSGVRLAQGLNPVPEWIKRATEGSLGPKGQSGLGVCKAIALLKVSEKIGLEEGARFWQCFRIFSGRRLLAIRVIHLILDRPGDERNVSEPRFRVEGFL